MMNSTMERTQTARPPVPEIPRRRALLSGEAKANFRANLLHQHVASFTFLLVVSASLETWPSLSQALAAKQALAAIAYLSLFSTAFAWMMFYRLVRDWGAVKASAVNYIVVGALAILSGVVLVQLG